MHVILGALLGAGVSAMTWELSGAQSIMNFMISSLVFGGGLWMVKRFNRHS